MERDELLLGITRCPELPIARRNQSHPCALVASIQATENYHVPEPWSGHIEQAPILFISSNPSISEQERYPTLSWSAECTSDYFQRRFDAGAGYVDARTYNRVPFWTGVRARAKEIFQREVVAGVDFALTEVVHCKSRGEMGVPEALQSCSQRWLSSVLAQSPATILIILGKHSQSTCSRIWNLDPARAVSFDVPVSGRTRAIVSLPHPNARQPRKIQDHVNPSDLTRLRLLL